MKKITGENRRNLRIKQLSNPLYTICQLQDTGIYSYWIDLFKDSNMVHPKEKLRFNMREEFHPFRDNMDYLHKIFHPAYNHSQEYIMIKQMIYKTRTEAAKT